MGPMEVCQHITNNFAVSAATYTDDENGYQFHIQVDGAIQFSSFYAYGKEDLQGAIDDVTSVLIKMGLERGDAFCTRCEPTGKPVTLADSASILKTLYPPGDFPAILQKNISILGAKRGAEASRPFDGLSAYLPDGFKVADGLIAKEKEGPTLDEEFPVQPNGFRWL